MVAAFTPCARSCINAVIIYDPPTPSVGETVAFNASLSTTNWNSTIQEEIPIVSYEWNFGDGTTGTGVIVNHAYNQEGTYNVTLTITDEEGANDTATIPVTVEESSTGSGFPWWIIVVVVAAAGIGVAVPVYFIKVRKPT